MGRKSIAKERRPLSKKAKLWVRELTSLLQNKSLDKLTLDEIAELAGKSKSTIYTYFSTKEEIYMAVIQSILDEIDFVISAEAIEGDDLEQVYRNLLLKLSEGIQGLSISFIEQIQLFFPEAWSLIEVFSRKVIANFVRIYQKGMERGDFKTFNIDLLTALDNHFIMSIMTNANKFEGQGLSFHDLVTEYLELRLSALRVEKD